MQTKSQSFRQRQGCQRGKGQLLSVLSTLMLLTIAGFTQASAQTQQTYWLGRLVGTEYVFDTRLPADFAAMVTASDPKYAAYKTLAKSSTQVIDGETYSFVTTDVSWDKDAIDNGSISFVDKNGMLGAAWFNMDASSAEWKALAQQVKDQATVASADGAWKRAELLVLISPNAEAPTVQMSIFGEQERYWLGRPDGTEYVFDTPLPPDFAAKILAADPNKYFIDKTPREFLPQNVGGAEYSFVKTQITYDKPQFDKGQLALVRKPGTTDMSWIDGKLKSTVGEPLAKQLPAPKQGEWKSVDMIILISPNAEMPTVRVPIPETTLAKIGMYNLGEETKPGLYYPQVKIPADLDAFRAQMLAYGNAGRRDADFRKYNEAKTATDLSGETVDAYADDSKTRTHKEKVFRQSETPPYFNDHVLNDKLNQAAQFQAEYQASRNQMGHDGPRSFTDPNTGKSGDLSTLGKRAEFFGVASVVEAAGGGAPGNAPHSWMASDTHFRPWFNVDGCYPEIGYGAAVAANGTWYYAAVPERDAECLNASATAQPQPTAPSTSTPPTTPTTPDMTQASSLLANGQTLQKGVHYTSESGNHFLTLNPDGNLVVARTVDDGYVWGFDTNGVDYQRVARVDMQADGNLAAYDANGGYIWSALTENPDPSARLVVTPEGLLQIVSPSRGVMWSSDGNAD